MCETLIDDIATAGILLSVIEKSDVLLVLLRELLKYSWFKEISDMVLSEVFFFCFFAVFSCNGFMVIFWVGFKIF